MAFCNRLEWWIVGIIYCFGGLYNEKIYFWRKQRTLVWIARWLLYSLFNHFLKWELLYRHFIIFGTIIYFTYPLHIYSPWFLICEFSKIKDYGYLAMYHNHIQLKMNKKIRLVKMLMYGKEASNRKQEIDRQHYTIPNQRPKDKHCGKI